MRSLFPPHPCYLLPCESTPRVETSDPRAPGWFEMTMRLCVNCKCPSYGRVVYTGATRCLFCKWDLMPTWTQSEIVAAQKPGQELGDHAQARTHPEPRRVSAG